MDKKSDLYWFNEILLIEKKFPEAQRIPDSESDLSFSNSFTEEQIEDYFMIDDRLEYLSFVRNHRDEISEESYQWLFDDIPNLVNEEHRVSSADFEQIEREFVENV